MHIPVSLKYDSFIYDFSKDGGNVGIIPMGAFVSHAALATGSGITITVLDAFTSATSTATVQIVTIVNSINLSLALIVTGLTLNSVRNGINTATVGVIQADQLAIKIAGENLLTGRAVVNIMYWELPN